MTSKEVEAKAKADVDARRALGGARVGVEATPAPTKQPADDPVFLARGAEAPAGGVKRMSDDVPAPPPKRSRRRKPEDLGTRDG